MATAANAPNDPFAGPPGPARLRHAAFDTSLLTLGPGTSAEQAKHALEAHLADTDRRMEEAGKLGTALVQQRKELAERLKEVEQLQAEGELTPDLRQRLVEIEKDYNEVARESARAFLPKSRVSSAEAAAGSPYVPEGKGGRRSVSPSKFESQATGSPTKFGVPNRKIRNQPQNRIHDIEFAAEISTSLISQVRNLQALLSEREDELREIKADRSRLEIEAEGFEQRMKSLDESEHRYKDENWNLETQIHELIAAQKDAADREKKLSLSLNVLQADKTSTQRELDEVKLNLSKLDEKHSAAVKQHDIELGTAKRKEVMSESERTAMQRKIEDLTSQNQELAKAFSAQRGRALEREAALGMSDEDLENGQEVVTPEHSPPPSPVKGTPRHSILESETLKTSLHHAQRTIQSLRTNVHREKTEKLELRRMLQEARDELEKARGDPTLAHKRSRKLDSKELRKSQRIGQLGGARSSRNEIYMDDPNWEDHVGDSPTHSSAAIAPVAESGSDAFETANDASDAAFETAHERGTETEDFHTGAEDISDDDAATETETSPSKGAAQRPAALPLNRANNRYSFQSTASTSDDDGEYGQATELKTPTGAGPQKMRLRVSRGAMNRRSRLQSEEPTFQSSPASFATDSASGTPQLPAQSLFAELGEFEGSDDESNVGGATPSRRSLRSVTPGSTRGRTASPPPEMPAMPKVVMVDSGMMTEPVDVRPAANVLPLIDTRHVSAAGSDPSLLSPQSAIFHERPTSMGSGIGPSRSVASTQWLGDDLREDHSRPQSSYSYSDAGAQHDPDMLAQFPSPPTSPLKAQDQSRILAPPQSLSIAQIQAEHIEPRADPVAKPPTPPILTISSLVSQDVTPVAEQTSTPPALALSTVRSEHVEPIAHQHPSPPILALSSVHSQELQPIHETPAMAPVPTPPQLSFSPLQVEEVQPVHEAEKPAPVLSLASITSQHIEPIHPIEAVAAAGLGFAAIDSVDDEAIQARSPKRDAFIIPRDEDIPAEAEAGPPRTPTGGSRFGSILGWGRSKGKSKASESPIIAEDDTRQSLNATPVMETPESQRPLKEVSGNTDARPPRKQPVSTLDQSAQTTLTAEALDEMLKAKTRAQDEGSIGFPSTHRRHKSRESMDSVIRHKIGGAEPEALPLMRPSSSASRRSSIADLPPLPPNHKEVIEAARSGSASGGQGSMGPPLYPASAYKNQNNPLSRPRTPSGTKPLSPTGTPTPRATRFPASQGTADVYQQSRPGHQSRKSSVSSFASEIDHRFNTHNGMAFDPTGFGPNTDPRMIQAITQTMIGEYLWKYTRKTGRGEMSENRHRRYFWVHPYTRTLYWSEHDPSTAGRSELRAKSVAIEAVRVVTDDNPMPPGLHRKSLVILSPGRTVKFTCTTGQRHETWFNALSYLLLRTGEDGQNDAEEMAGNLTREDVDEFNPQVGRRGTNGTRSKPPPSLASYNSRRSRHTAYDSMDMAVPTLTPSTPLKSKGSASRPSTIGRLSGYFGSLRSRSHSISGRNRTPLYDNSEAHDSAEDLRQMIEKQDREAARMENVRACCDGKHDVGSLPHSSKRGRGHQYQHSHSHSYSHSRPGSAAATPSTPTGTFRSRSGLSNREAH